jgi:hypothetical protein
LAKGGSTPNAARRTPLRTPQREDRHSLGR